MAKARKEASVGGEQSAENSRWHSAFAWALVAISVAVIVLLVAVAGAFGGSGPATSSGTPVAAVSLTPNGPTATQAGAIASATKAANFSPTADPAGSAAAGADNTPLVRCGDILAPVDKQHRLAPDCVPPDLTTLPGSISAEGSQSMRAETASAIQELFAAARKDGYTLLANSTYRSYDTQVQTYNYWVQTSGKDYADRTSAQAGHSEHQMGTAADVGTDGHFLEGFSGTPSANWLADNSWKYGFIVSYPEGKEGVTGYAAEPWHIRYVGKDVASKVRSSGLTLHEYLLR
jgi:zinc D-Ala-D-Ala carboxypeptidase